MRYRGILMDADDTLFDFQAGNRAAVNRLMDEIGYFDPDRYEQYEAFNRACWAELEKGRMTQARLQTARFERFFERYGIAGDPAATGQRFAQLLGQQAVMRPGAEAAVRAVAAKLPVLILTNGITVTQKSRLARSPIGDVVAGMVISQEVGVAKPDPRIFRIALGQLGIGRREALMIGDGVNSDIRGANNAGVDACWLNPDGAVLPGGVHAEYEIADIRDCVGIALMD